MFTVASGTLKRLSCTSVLIVALNFIFIYAWSQAQVLKDINQREDVLTNEYSKLTDANGTLYFVSRSSELWKSDGTVKGTTMVKRFQNIGDLKLLGNIIFLSVIPENGNGPELWKSDGTADGTEMIRMFGGYPESFTDVNGVLYFTGLTAANGKELWKSDGTAAGTVMLKDIMAKKGSSNPRYLINVNGTLFFSANDGTNGYELWKSGGTAETTVLVRDINTGTRISSSPERLTNVNGTVYFTASDGPSGRELWKSDGTETGTIQLRDIRSGSSTSGIENLAAVNNTLFFTASDGIHGHELWKSDGTTKGTVLVKDMTPGPAGSHGEVVFMFRMGNFTDVNGTLFYTAYQNNEYFIWKSDGTEAGTMPVQPSPGFGIAGPTPKFTWMNGSIYYINETDGQTDDMQLYKMDANGENADYLETFVMTDFYNPYEPEMVRCNNNLYIAARLESDKGFKLIKSDGTEEGTGEFFDTYSPNNDSNPTRLMNVNGTVYFHTDIFEDYWEEEIFDDGVWKTDGTSEGTMQLIDELQITAMEPVNDLLFASGYDKYYNYWQCGKRMAQKQALKILLRLTISPVLVIL